MADCHVVWLLPFKMRPKPHSHDAVRTRLKSGLWSLHRRGGSYFRRYILWTLHTDNRVKQNKAKITLYENMHFNSVFINGLKKFSSAPNYSYYLSHLKNQGFLQNLVKFFLFFPQMAAYFLYKYMTVALIFLEILIFFVQLIFFRKTCIFSKFISNYVKVNLTNFVQNFCDPSSNFL